MAITNASRVSDFGSGIGTVGAVLQVDNTNERIGIGTTNPQAMLQVGTAVTVYGNSGIVSATSFYGDGSNLSGVAFLADNSVDSDQYVDGSIDNAHLADDAIDLTKLPHGDESSDGKFLRSNNGADPTWETVTVPTLSDPIVTGDLEVTDGGTVSHTITNWSDDITYVFSPTNCTIGAVNTSGVFVVTETGDHPSYTIKATTTKLGLDDSSVITKTLKTKLSAPTLSGPAYGQTVTNAVITITSTNANDDKLILDIGSSNFSYGSVSHGSASKVGNTVEVTGFGANNPAVTIQFTVEATYSVTAKAVDTGGTFGDSVSSSAASIIIANTYTSSFLLLAGGGGPNGAFSGGGGAGGLRSSWNNETSGGGASAESPLVLTPGTVYTITIGAGGLASQTGLGDLSGSASGEDSTITGTGFVTITSNGGGTSQAEGGCGGGKSRYIGTGGAGTTGEGYKGGDHTGAPGQDNVGAGGGGTGSVGGDTSGNTAGDGGNGCASTITGSSVTRGGGGGGGTRTTAIPGAGGSGGGGDAHACTPGDGAANANGDAGGINLGGGGGAGALCYYVTTYHWGGHGGSGFACLRMPTSDYSGTQTNGSVTTNGADTIIQWNTSGTYQG